jgi:hypothetical protein
MLEAMPLEPATLEVLAATPATLHALLPRLPSDALERQDAGGWSARDVVAHLVDRGRIQRARVDRLAAESGATIEDSDERATLEASGLRASPLADLLQALALDRERDLAYYRALSDEELTRQGAHTVVGMITIANLINQAAFHDLQHLAQIANAIATLPHAGRGALASF